VSSAAVAITSMRLLFQRHMNCFQALRPAFFPSVFKSFSRTS
jgi:hypothetical protein